MLWLIAGLVVAALVLALTLMRRERQRRKMRAYFNSLAHHVGAPWVRKPLVLDIGGQDPEHIHVETIAHGGIRRKIRAPDWVPAQFVSWYTDTKTIAMHAFRRGYDALVLTNCADGEVIAVVEVAGSHRVTYIDKARLMRLTGAM